MRPLTYTAGVVMGAVLGISVIAGWYAVTPRMTVDAMAAAAAGGDHEALASYMDMASLRADVRRRVADALSNRYPPGHVILDPRRVTEALAGKAIDETFSRSGTRRMLERHAGGTIARDVHYVILRHGPNGFVARLDSPRRVDLLFSRHGLTWLLSGIAMRPAARPDVMI